MVTGIFSVYFHDARVLFDSGATHSFVSPSFASCLGRDSSPLSEHLIVATPMGDSLLAGLVYKSCEVWVGGKLSIVDLIVLDVVDFDVILSMDLLASCHDTLDCHSKVVKFSMPGELAFTFQGD